MAALNRHSMFRQSGFTLVEIMVGLVIGLLATMIIIQVLSVYEGQKRSTTGSADAQTNGSIALFNIVRETQLAGYPLMPTANSPLECTTLTFGATGITSIDPISITDAASDSITLRYGSSAMGGIPTPIFIPGAPTANDVTVGNTLGCEVNDIAFITNGTTCAMTSVTAISAPIAAITLQNTTAAVANGNLACLGRWNVITYEVINGNLVRDITPAVAGDGTPLVAGIVNIQAQYGISANAKSNQIVDWVDATGIWVAPTLANRNRIKALRIAVIARNEKKETIDVTNAITTWTGSASSPAPTVNLTAADADWKRYRYRVYETVIPLRNVIWSRETL